MGFLHSLECLCLKAGSGSIVANGTVSKAKISANPANITVKIQAVGKLISPPAPKETTKNILFATSNSYTHVVTVSNTTGLSWVQVGDLCYIDHQPRPDLFQSGYRILYNVVAINGSFYTIQGLAEDPHGDDPILSLCSEWNSPTCVGNCSCVRTSITFTNSAREVNPRIVRERASSVTLSAVANINSKLTGSLNLFGKNVIAQGILSPRPNVIYGVRQKVAGEGDLRSIYTDKFSGDFGDFECLQKLYPINDIDLPETSGIGVFTGPLNQTDDLYSFIDEGVFVGDYDKKFGQSTLLADEKNSFIQPSAINTLGSFRYKCEVTKPVIRPEETFLRIRASAPISNYEAGIPPKYVLKDIKFEDPFGNLIVQYNDIILRGDADHYDVNFVNFATYSSAPKVNKAKLYEWQSGYPAMHEASGYTLSFNLDVTPLDAPFDFGYNSGFEEFNKTIHNSYASGNDYLSLDGSPLSTNSQRLFNPTHGIKISALEICNSGGLGPRPENYINIYAEVDKYGRRIERAIYPTFMPVYGFDTNIYPAVSSVWNYSSYSNLNKSGSSELVSALRETTENKYITLNSTGPLSSGKLTLRFGHEPVGLVSEVTNGQFNCAFDQSICDMWIEPSGAFSTLQKSPMFVDDHFFVVESVSLKVLAKKAVGSPNYSLDVVGYSDDKILNISSAVGGFLQNVSGVGTYPTASGFAGIDDFALDGEAISDKSQYYTKGANNAGGDHYILSNYPVISSTDFKWYEIPLKVYEDSVKLGKSRDYSMSSLFEKLYLDIYPIPSGASIASIYLLVRYAPQTAINLVVEGGENIRKIQDGRSEGSLYPTSRNSNDYILNAGSGYAPISKIENIPHAYSTPTTIKSNYSRRWRGMEGTVQGPFDPDMFGFGFSNPLLDFPFLLGYYDFDYDSGLSIKPRVGSLSGTLTTTYSPYKYKNLGWRFTSGTLFNTMLPGYSGAYQTTDWTSLASGATNFQSHPLYGQIADAFNNVVRVSGKNSYINFGNTDTNKEFSLFIRFTPDANVSGVGYDLFQSGCLISKWNTGSPLEFALGYASGYLRGIARDISGNVRVVQDSTHYTTYQYPLSIVLTYNDHNSSGLKLYTDNEFEANWQTLRASSIVPFELYSGNSNLIVGNSFGSGVGMNMFVAELGISNKANIVYDNPDLTFKEVTAQKFLENHRIKWWDSSDSYTEDSYKLWDYVNENTYHDWQIGAFKYCSFGPDFNQLQKRTGRDLISFNIIHEGSGYSQYANIPLPSSINRNVAYHTQIENDFLRLHLSDASNNFYSTLPRITKNLPRDYKFADKALVVETVIEHESSGNIIWQDGNIGPKLIVSLYTKNQHPYWTPSESNWGLINRSIHYLESSTCMTRLDSTFTYDSLVDDSEAWAIFPTENRLKELKEKYYSQDINDMFLQYDLVYPSGSKFTSRLNVHSAHVRLEDAYVTAVDSSGILNLITSGNTPAYEQMNLFANGRYENVNNSLFLYSIGPLLIENSGLPLYISGALISSNILNWGIAGHSGVNASLPISISGGPSVPIIADSGALNLHLFGKGLITSEAGDNLGISLTALNTDTANVPDQSLLPLFAFADSGVSAIRSNIPIFILNNLESDVGSKSGVLNLTMIGSSALFNRYPNAVLNLFTFNNNSRQNLNLTLYGDNYNAVSQSGTMNMFTANYSMAGSPYLRWFNENYGTSIDVGDNVYASLPANDEIRGVDLIGYGSCDGDSPKKAIDPAVITHDTVWREETCNEGGIFRAVDTYTNLSAGYSGNYYGIRKYDNLIPNAPYNVSLKVTTGSTESIQVPRELEEWEYGINNTINYSGIKLVGDYPYLSGNLAINPPSGRKPNDKYGYKVVAKKDLMAVGSPYHDLPDESGIPITNGGSVFLYRRYQDIAGQKANWYLEDKLMLPYGYRRDYISKVVDKLICYPDNSNPQFCVSGQKWNIGQQGREFGYSLDIAKSGEKETVIIGAPGAYWDRQFENITLSGIPVCMLVFTDKFTYDKEKIAAISNTARKWDTLYKYFSAPWASGFQPYLDINLIVCQLAFTTDDKPKVSPNESWFHHTYLERLDDKSLSYNYAYNSMLSGVKDVFFKAFPRNPNLVHSNIPPILGVFEDSSPSTTYKKAFKAVSDDFISFYKKYAYASGVIDPSVPVAASGYVNSISDVSEIWDVASKNLMSDTLNSGNLILNDALKYITSGIGQQWARINSYEFQIPPSSGGRVYVFEKENGIFNLIQEIKSPDETAAEFGSTGIDVDDEYYGDFGLKYNDRFGHSVSISENSEVLAIGSPYSSQACQIYEKDDTEDARMYVSIKDWLVYRGYTTQDQAFDILAAASGLEVARTEAYKNLSQSDKFAYRSDENFWKNRGGIISPYKQIYAYSYGDIAYTGTWNFITEKFAGTSRLGYSSAVSEDGNIVAFGAPTDSFNEFDDTNVWYKNENTWASYTNAGAVRVFEARKYYPHNKVVEFYKFGNLDRSSHPELEEYYNQMGLYFAPDDIPFERTDFSDVEIPRDAGLAFIITPEIDAASDEIIDNIKNWLALGDRTLVLVGNDPVWEENGKYNKSNKIINKILNKLNSKMRLHPARNEYESLPGCISQEDYFNDKYNVTASFVPSYAHNTYIPNSINLFAKGVADIRIDVSSYGLSGLNIKPPCDENNEYCNLPLADVGDLRAQWNATCIKTEGNKEIEIKYKENWPFHFGNENPAQACDEYPENPKPLINRKDQDPRPILTAAEWLPERIIVIPAQSGVDRICTPTERKVYENTTIWNFAENQVDQIYFDIRESGNSVPSGSFKSFTQGTFFDPDEIYGRDSLLQATGTPYFENPEKKYRKVSDLSVFAAEESYNQSKVVLIASLWPESDRSLGYSNSNNNNSDQNILFYNNLVMKDCNNKGNVVQVGGWTGRSSFQDAYSKSRLKDALESHEQTVTENVVYSQGDTIEQYVNVVWIANPLNQPSESDINIIKQWLNTNNKKLVITYGNDQRIAANVKYICEQLGLQMQPFYSTSQGTFIEQNLEYINRSNNQNCCPFDQYDEPVQILNEENIAVKGCSNYGWLNNFSDSSVDKLAIYYEQDFGFSNEDNPNFYIPVKTSNTTTKVVHYEQPVKEFYWESKSKWRINAESKVTFDVLPESGYRIFVNWVSEGLDEKFEVTGRINKINLDADPERQEEQSYTFIMGKTATFSPETFVLDFKAPSGVTNIELDFSTPGHNSIDPEQLNGSIPFTPRILSVSGCLLPVQQEYITFERSYPGPDVCEDIPWYIPEETIVIPPEFRPIKTDSSKYCFNDTDCPGQLLEDGPIVVAEEFESFSAFINGYERSRIVVISDSTIVQGQCPHYRNDALDENQLFIRSLYPKSPSSKLNLSPYVTNSNTLNTVRQFNFVQKIVAPERGSPAKYYAASGTNSFLVDKFGLAGVAGNLSNYTSDENQYNPADVNRPKNPLTEEAKKNEIRNFETTVIPTFGVFPRFSGIVNGQNYIDTDVGGGVPEILKLTGKDYLDIETYPSGYTGDLFGYSIDIHKNKLVIGSPFHGFDTEEIVSWDEVQVSGKLKISGNGGAGAVFYYEKTGSGENAVSEFLPWEFKQKIKPESVNVGLDNATLDDLTAYAGIQAQNLDSNFVVNNAIITDQFGYDVNIDADVLAVGAPGHDFGTLHHHVFSGSTAFIRKEFNAAFNIHKHFYYDLGSSGVRIDDLNNASGTFVLNGGAVFTFDHKIIDWQNRTKKWVQSEKLTAQGYNSRNQITITGCENDFFGRSVSIDRVGRGDSDYTLVVGSPNHSYTVSGLNFSEKAGAAYTYDAMLREQTPSIPNSGSWIKASVFGAGDKTANNTIILTVNQNTSGNSITYTASGLIFSNENGDIFLEASGYDPAAKGFVAHRPYIESIIGDLVAGTQTTGSLPVFISGKPPVINSNMNLFMSGDPSAFVYNNMNLITSSWTVSQVGSGNTPLNLTTIGTSGIPFSGGLNIVTSGIGVVDSTPLNLRIRGR